MKEKLLNLYKTITPQFRNIIASFPHDDLGGPFLMSPKAAYKLQKTPLMIVGQETSGWSYFIDDPEKQMSTYENFDVGRDNSNGFFWNTIRKLESVLGNEAHTCAWTNFNRFDLYGGRVHGKFEKSIAAFDHLVVEELKIATPELCIFFTGPYYDNRLSRLLNGLTFETVAGWNPKQLCQLKHPDLPARSFRTYHPRFLKLNYLEERFLQFIANTAVYK